MGYNNNQFPVFLTLKSDGSLETSIKQFESFAVGSMQRVTKAATSAGSSSSNAFGFERALADIGALEKRVASLKSTLANARTDPFGISNSLAAAKGNGVLGNLPAQIAAEKKLNDERMRAIDEVARAEQSLAQQRQAAIQERIAGISREFDVAMNSIRERKAAELAAFAAIQAEGDRMLALDRQRAEEQRRLVAGREFIQAPGFNPAAANAAAIAARQHAIALDQVARAAEQVANEGAQATATDRAFAAQMRESANAANLEANRLDALAATQNRVSGAARGLNADNLSLATSQRGTRQATLQASQQFQDFFIQIQSGQNPMVAFSQQASQLAFVMSNAGGAAGRFATFMSGGWGTMLFIGLAALTPLVSKLFESEDAAKKATKAKQLHKQTLEQLIETINAETEALGKANQSSRDSELAALNAANAKVLEIRRRLENAQAILAEAKAQTEAARSQTFGAAGGAGAGAAVAVYSQAVTDLEATIAKLQAATGVAALGVARAAQPVIRREEEARRDPRKRVDLDFDDAMARASRQFDIMVGSGVSLNDAQVEYTRLLREASDRRARETKVIDDREAAEREAAAAARRAANQAERTEGYATFDLPFARSTVTSGFGNRRSPTTGASTNHQAVDFGVPAGTQVRNPGTAGVVIHAGRLGGYGNAVIVDHGGGTITQYSHLASILTSQGAKVDKGDVLGTVGSTGLSTGAHLDYKLKTGGKYVDPLKVSRVKVDDSKVELAAIKATEKASEAAQRAAQKAQQEQDRLGNFATRAADRVAGITAQFDKQPRLIDQAGAAMRDLQQITAQTVKAQAEYDALIQRLREEKPEGFEIKIAELEAGRNALGQILEDAKAAGPVVQEGLVRPLQDFVNESAKVAEIDALVLAGKEDQAEVMQQIYRLEEAMGPLTDKQRVAVEKTVLAERLRGRALQENERAIQRAVQAAEQMQDAIADIVKDPFKGSSWTDAFGSIFENFREQWSQNVTRNLFGDLGGQMEDAMRMKSDPLGQAGDELTQSAIELHKSAVALAQSAQTIASASPAAGPTAGQIGTTPTAFAGIAPALSSIGRAFGGGGGAGVFGLFGQMTAAIGQQTQATSQNLSVNVGVEDLQRRQLELQKRSALMADPVQYYNTLGRSVGSSLDKTLGTGGLFGSIGGKLGQMMQGVQLGQMGASVLELFGLKANKGTGIGSAIGGALGSFLGPIGSMVGGLVGGLIGGLLGKPAAKKGTATIGGDTYGNLDVTDTRFGNRNRLQEANKMANNTIDAIERLAEQLGVELNAALGSVSIGMRDEDYRVDTRGQGRTVGAGVINFGKDAEGAIERAIIDLILDGVLEGIRDGTKRLLVGSRDLTKGIEKAMKFEGVFKRLREIEDPVGAAIDELNREFNDLRRVFAEAGASAAELADLERLYALERAEAIKSAAKDMTSTLKALLEDLTFKGDYGLSLRTRRSNALGALAPFQQQIGAGQAVDQEAFAETVRALLEVERALYGSTSQYFETLNMITQLTRMAIGNTGTPVSIPGISPGPAAMPGQTGSTTSPVPGVSNVAPGGLPPGASPLQAAANDNYATAQMIIVAIREQTAAIIPLISQNAITSAIQTAFVNMRGTLDESGNLEFAMKPIAQAVLVSNGEVAGLLSQLVDYTKDELEETRNMRSALTAPTAVGAAAINPNSYHGMFPTIPQTVTESMGRRVQPANSDGTEEASRIRLSVSGF